MKRIAMILLLASSVTLAAVGMADATPLAKKSAAKQYLAIAGPVNTAASNFLTQVNGWTASITNAQAENEAKPSLTALLNFHAGLTHDRWPTAMKADIKALSNAVVPLIADLRSLSSDNLQIPTPIVSKFSSDLKALGTRATAVRRVLGLPPTTS